MKAGFLSIVLVLAFLPLLIQGLEVHGTVYSGMEEMKNTLILQQRVHEAIYEIENGFRMAVENGLKSVNAMYALDPTDITEKIARGIVCGAVESWERKNPEYKFMFNCLISLQVNVYKRSARLYTDFVGKKEIHKAKVTVKIPAGTVIGA